MGKKLTPKQARFVEETERDRHRIRAFCALYEMGMMFGMWDFRRTYCQPLPPKEVDPVAVVSAAIVFDSLAERDPIAASCAAMILDFYIPQWRAECGYDELPRLANQEWRNAVLARDDHRCQVCDLDRCLHAHHIIPRRVAPLLRNFEANGATLCGDCHRMVHHTMGGYLFATEADS